MSRFLAPGSVLNQIWGSTERWPELQVLVWNPNETTIGKVARGEAAVPPVDISAFVKSLTFEENIGYESLTNPQVTFVTMILKSDDGTGRKLRRGLVEDGVIVRVYQGDTRVEKEGWLPVFTGTFRGVPGVEEGTRATAKEGITAKAWGREERFLNRSETTRKYPTQAAIDAAVLAGTTATVDIGVIAADVAKTYMGLDQKEVLFGAFGFVSKHIVNQLVDIPVLQAIAECMFPVRAKPKFDELGRLKKVDVDFDKPPVRVYRGGDALIESVVRAPSEAEVANRVILTGLAAKLSRVGPTRVKVLVDLQITLGFFEEFKGYEEEIYFSDDRMLRATNTDATAKTSIVYGPGGVSWANLSWSPETSGPFKDRRGTMKIDTVWGAVILGFFFRGWLVLKTLAYAAKLAGQKDAAASLDFWGDGFNAALVIVMNFIGRGRYEITGKPYEEVYQELESRCQLRGLDEEEMRTAEFRNDFISDLDTLDAECEQRLRRELVKDQLYEIVLLDDPVLEVDDIIELSPKTGSTKGDRFYIVSVSKTLSREARGVMKVVAWKIMDGFWAETIEPLQLAEAV